MINLPTVLAILAHPDDAELRCFGTLCKYKEKGYRSINLILCDGENGISIEDKERLGIELISQSVRLEETRRAFDETGIEIDTLSFCDGNILLGRSLIMEIEKKIKKYKPEIIITHYPDELCTDHQDHSNVGKAVINCATRISSVKRILLCEPQMPLRSSFKPNLFIDISEYFKKKTDTLKCHKTQDGRYYLTYEFQQIKASYYASSVGFKEAKVGRKYEAFYQLFAVEE